jgi:hypothetical protein
LVSPVLVLAYPVTLWRKGGLAARAIHGTHFAYVKGILAGMSAASTLPRQGR